MILLSDGFAGIAKFNFVKSCKIYNCSINMLFFLPPAKNTTHLPLSLEETNLYRIIIYQKRCRILYKNTTSRHTGETNFIIKAHNSFNEIIFVSGSSSCIVFSRPYFQPRHTAIKKPPIGNI